MIDIHSSFEKLFPNEFLLQLAASVYIYVHDSDALMIAMASSCLSDFVDDKSSLVEAMAGWHQATTCFLQRFRLSNDIKNNAGITIVSDFWDTSEAICQ